MYLYTYNFIVLYKYHDKFYHNSFITLQNLIVKNNKEYTYILGQESWDLYLSDTYVLVLQLRAGFETKAKTPHSAMLCSNSGLVFIYFTPYPVVHC